MQGENLSGIRPTDIKLPTFIETAGIVPPTEVIRLSADWQKTVNLVWKANEPLLEINYASDERIISDLKLNDPSNPQITPERDRRKQEQKAAQTTDTNEIALQLIHQDGRFTGKNITDNEVQAEAAKESERRKGLLKAKKDLYDAEDEINGIKAVAEREMERVFEDAKNKRLQELTAEARKTDPNATDITTLQLEEELRLKGEIEKIIIPQYCDTEQGIYYRLKEGKPDKANLISTPDAYKPVYEELKQIAEGKRGNPEQVEEAQNLRKTLIYVQEKHGFKVYTEEEIKRREMDEDGEKIMLEANRIISKKVEGLDGYDDLFTRDDKREIKDVDTKKLEKMLKELPQDGETGHYLFLMRAYRDTKIPQEKRYTILSLLYHSVRKVNPDIGKSLKNGQDLNDLPDHNIRGSLINSFKVKPELLTDLPYDHILDILQIAKVVQSRQDFIVAAGDRFALSPKVKQFLSTRPNGLTPRDEELIVHFARYEGSAELFFQSVLGIEASYITDNKALAGYLQETVNEIVASKSNPKEQDVYRKILNRQIDDEQLNKIAKEKGLPPAMGYGLMLLLIFAPSIQGLLGIGLGGEEESGGSGGR